MHARACVYICMCTYVCIYMYVCIHHLYLRKSYKVLKNTRFLIHVPINQTLSLCVHACVGVYQSFEAAENI